jgi:hypothetical protein
MALRWKKNPRPSGLYGVIAGPQGSKLRDGGIEYANTRCLSRSSERKGWYWVARNDEAGVPLKNTCYEPVPDEAAAKAAAMAYVKSCIKAQAESASTENGQRGSGHAEG